MINEPPATQGPDVAEAGLTDVYPADDSASADWRVITDQVMGGVSTAALQQDERWGAACICLRGRTRLENNGGFVQMKYPIAPNAALADYAGLFIELCGPAHEYELRVKTSQLDKPWQSFRHGLAVTPQWTRFVVPYAQLQAHRTEATLDPARILSVAVVAIGSEFEVEVCVRRLGFYR